MMEGSRALPINHIVTKPSTGKPIINGTRLSVEFIALLSQNPEWSLNRIVLPMAYH